MKRVRLTTEDLIAKAKEVHGDKYDYSKTVFATTKKKVTIICPEHGEFEQAPEKHIRRSQGCPKCAKRGKLSNSDIIEQFTSIHGKLYDYSLVNYKNELTKVDIICGKHGAFAQLPLNHKRGVGCPSCVKPKQPKFTYEEFKDKINIIYGSSCELPFLDKILVDEKITIKNVVMGSEHSIRVGWLLKGVGLSIVNAVDKTDFIKKEFVLKHGDTYNYDLVHYNGKDVSVKIICPVHGIFKQTPMNHKLGSGCPTCKESKGEREIRELLINNNTDFVPQHTFDDCKHVRCLPFDFYLPEHNICIEYHGIQHYEPIEFFGGLPKFKERQYRDKIKGVYCKNNSIPLIKIKYNEDVSNVLNDYFNVV